LEQARIFRRKRGCSEAVSIALTTGGRIFILAGEKRIISGTFFVFRLFFMVSYLRKR
jgi:hypothetical protein